MPEVSFNISDVEQRRVNELLAAIRTESNPCINPESFLAEPKFVEEFQTRLLAQHVFLKNPMFQESFDTAFVGSARAAGKEVIEAPPGQRFWDVSIDGKRISLKSSKAKSLRKDVLHISKLTEAAWIQECRSAKVRRQHTMDLFDSYCAEVEEIIQLRYFQRSGEYEMVGLPVALLRQILDLPAEVFNADGPSINIPIGASPPDYTLKLDRSDAKITLARILKERCVLHATWKIAS